jgi:osmotically inducible protein OsmC
MAERTATAAWDGTLTEGNGVVSLRSSGILSDSPITWQARTEESGGLTSPEELLAGAHAACFSMAFANTLAKAGHEPDHIDTTAVCAFEQREGGYAVTTMHLTVRAAVPGIDEATFQELAGAAKVGCPISKAITGNVQIGLDAALT